MKTLRDVAIGSTCTVKKLHGEGAVKRRIMDSLGRSDGGHRPRLSAFHPQG